MFTEEQINLYLRRIGCADVHAPDLEFLRRLQYNHLLYVPYENLDPMNGVPLSLASEDLFTKIILHDRGGFCFELQGLFCHLLVSLGYRVTQYAGRFMDVPGQIQMRRHRVLVVDLDSRQYVCDVGVRSESPRIPLEFSEGKIQSDAISEYRYHRDSFYGWVLEQKESGKPWKPLLGFTEEVQVNDDYIMPCFFCEKHPDSTFNKFMKISRFTPDSSLTIVENTFKVYRHGCVIKRQVLESRTAVKASLRDTFGISVPESYGNLLWADAAR